MGALTKKSFFWPFGPQFGLKIRGGGPPGPSPGSDTGFNGVPLSEIILVCEQFLFSRGIEAWQYDYQQFKIIPK